MTPEDWIDRFERLGMHTLDPRRCTVVPDGASSVYAALYDLSAFASFDEFDAWLAWTLSLQPTLLTDGPTAAEGWKGPATLKLPHTPLVTGRPLREAIVRWCLQPELHWVHQLRPVKGRIQTSDTLEAKTMEGWLTLFRLADDEEESLTWTRVDLPGADWRAHLISDLAIRLPVELEGLGHFDAAHGPDGSRVWFKASATLVAALEHRDTVAGDLARQLVVALRRGEAVYLPEIGQLTADEVVDARGAERRTTFVIRFQGDTEFLLDLDEAVQARTLPPGR
jgi:hypothetical protein